MQGIRSDDGSASDGRRTVFTVIGELIRSNPRRSHAGSPTTTGRQWTKSRGQARATISGPTPATSPNVISSRGGGADSFGGVITVSHGLPAGTGAAGVRANSTTSRSNRVRGGSGLSPLRPRSVCNSQSYS